VSALAITVLVLEIALDAQRVVAWVLTAFAIAALVQPLVEFLERYMPRGLAVLLVVVLFLGSIGLISYRIVQEVGDQTKRLQEVAPERARELERDSELLREINFSDRVERLVDSIPERLRGGTTAEAIRSAANRGVAALAGIVLTLFFVLYAPTLIDAAYAQIRNTRRRQRVERIGRAAAARGFGYARLKVGVVVVEGVLAFVIARLAGVPGPAALAVWVALWSLIPVAGLFIGAVPIIAFAAAESETTAILVAVAFVAIGVAEWLVIRQIERRVLRVGSFLTAIALFAGLELYGFSGALLLLLIVILLVAVVSEMGPEEVGETVLAPLAGAEDPKPPEA
jgi:predicted PurR-regulated permease PerM